MFYSVFAIFTVVQEKSERDDLGADDQQLALKVLHELKLVPEHVETRTLYNPMQPRISQVHLHTLDRHYILPGMGLHRFIRRHKRHHNQRPLAFPPFITTIRASYTCGWIYFQKATIYRHLLTSLLVSLSHMHFVL